jgi:uncharacterized protein (UPF0261 family)
MLIAELPESLQQQFVQTAQKLFDHDAVKRATIEAVESWLTNQRKRQVDLEAKANDPVFEKRQAELERDHFGQWIVIAHGELGMCLK